jgi:hypothetical protein
MACNLPVVAATGVGMSDVGDSRLSHVWTFTPEDVTGCSKAIADWLASHREGIRGCNHREFAVSRLSPERCYGAVLCAYENKELPGSISPFPESMNRPARTPAAFSFKSTPRGLGHADDGYPPGFISDSSAQKPLKQ